MGNWFSSSPTNTTQQPQRDDPLTTAPWRKIKGWDRGERCDLKDHVAGLAPQTRGQLDVPFFNIALTGQIGAGKSSFFNSVSSIYRERVIAGQAEVGISARSLTQQFRVYEINPNPASPDSSLAWRICDTAGLDHSVDTDYDVRNILKAVDGNVPDRFEFPNHELLQDNHKYIPMPELKDKAHCVAVVIDGNSFGQMSDAMKRKLKTLRTDLIARNIPTYILLTHIDEACVEVSKNVNKVYHSIIIRDLVHKVSKLLLGLPENQIFPIVNYKEQVELEDNVDILLLYALRQMLYSAQGHLENRMESRNK